MIETNDPLRVYVLALGAELSQLRAEVLDTVRLTREAGEGVRKLYSHFERLREAAQIVQEKLEARDEARVVEDDDETSE